MVRHLTVNQVLVGPIPIDHPNFRVVVKRYHSRFLPCQLGVQILSALPENMGELDSVVSPGDCKSLV